MDISDIPQVETKVKADIGAAKAEETKVKSWFAANWQYAVAIAVGSLFLGASLGMKLGIHLHS